jgi:hypothetical protein
MNLRETGCEDSNKWLKIRSNGTATVNIAIKFRVPQKAENFLTELQGSRKRFLE